MSEPEIELCSEKPSAVRSACVREAGHEGKCVFARGNRAGSAVTLYEKGRGQTFRAIYELELMPGSRLSRVEVGALLAAAEAARRRRLR